MVRFHYAWRAIPLDFRLPNRLRIRGDMRDVIVRTLYFEGVWEKALTRLLEATLRPGDVFVDVGANFGVFSLLAAGRVGPSGAVVAVEASPATFARLVDHVRRNGADTVRCVNAAAADRPGRVKVFQGGADNAGGTLTIEDRAEIEQRHATFEAEVEAKPLAEIVPRDLWGSIRMVKIDVEGAEAAVLRGLEPMLPALPPAAIVVVELNRRIPRRDGIEPAAPLAPYLAAGFRPFHVPDDDDRIVPVHDLEACFNRFDTANIALSRQPL